MKSPAVSVVIPVYNAERTLPLCMESVLCQQVEGGLQCILIDDGSTDDTTALCKGYADTDPRVTALHIDGTGVSAARNAGVDAATGRYLVFLDADDCLLPGALQAALDAQAAAPGCFILWHYIIGKAAVPPPLSGYAPCPGKATPVRRPCSDLATLYLDCLIAMPWNKLYSTEIAKKLRFNSAYTLGEDLQFVLDYIDALAEGQGRPNMEDEPFSFAVMEQELTYYDCSKSDGTLSTRYLPDYCRIWPEHYARLNEVCARFNASAEEMVRLHRAQLRVMGEGIADILRRDPADYGLRRDKAIAMLCQPWLRGLLHTLKEERSYSPYYLPLLWRNLHLLYTLSEAGRTGSRWFGRLDWAGYYLLLGRYRRA